CSRAKCQRETAPCKHKIARCLYALRRPYTDKYRKNEISDDEKQQQCLFLAFELEGSCYVETKVNITVEKVVQCFGNKGAFGKADCVREYKLKNVTTGFNVDAKAERVVKR